jgi:hypothetical protein
MEFSRVCSWACCCRMLCFSVDICVLSATGNETKSVSERETLPDDAAVPTRKAGEGGFPPGDAFILLDELHPGGRG